MFDELAFDLSQLEEAWDQRKEYLDFLEGEAGERGKETERQRKAREAREQLIATGIDLAEIVYADHLKTDERFAFYHLPIPLSVFPPPGTFIQTVEVQLHFNPGTTGQAPVIHDIFPRRKFQDALRFDGGLEIGITDALKFGFTVFGGTAASQVTTNFLEPLVSVLPGAKLSTDYEFLIRKPIILASITGSDVALWRFSGRQHFEKPEHLRFGVVFAVPLELKRVRVAKVVKARRRNQSLKRLLAQDLERLQNARELLDGPFDREKIDGVIERFKRMLRNEWNVVQEEQPTWNLDSDMVH